MINIINKTITVFISLKSVIFIKKFVFQKANTKICIDKHMVLK